MTAAVVLHELRVTDDASDVADPESTDE